jgi:hypothetical protein
MSNDYDCMFKLPVKLVGERGSPNSFRKYVSLVREATLSCVPMVGMSVQLGYADIGDDGDEDESNDYVMIEHVHYDLPNERFLLMCREHRYGVEVEWDRKVEELKKWGWSGESV